MPQNSIITRSKKRKALASYQDNRLEEARRLYEEICSIDRLDTEAWSALAEINHRLGNIEGAIECLHQLSSVKPEIPEIHFNLGNFLREVGRPREAIDSYKRALQIKPDFFEAWCNLGSLFNQLKQRDEAIGCFRYALDLKPDIAEIHYNLGGVLQAQGEYLEAEKAYLVALKKNPKFSQAYINLGSVLDKLGRYEEALSAYQQAEILDPSNDILYHNLGKLCKSRGQIELAVHYYLKSLKLNCDSPETQFSLANAYLAQGQLDQALASYRQSLKLDSNSPAVNSNYLLAIQYSPTFTPEQFHIAHRVWGKNQATNIIAHSNRRELNSNKKLKIGYVSPDFRTHSVAYFIEPVLVGHDRIRFEIYCYADVEKKDSTTDRIKKSATYWRETQGMSDNDLAKLIQDDQIDILVDLAGHTRNNRLKVFSLKPAPIQVSYLGYPDTTGLPQMDYRLTDALADPPGREAFYTEQLVRLKQGFLCYLPPVEAPAVVTTPAAHNGYVTFGSFNALPKVNVQVVASWSQLLKAVPKSRLILKNLSLRDTSTAEKYRQMFISHKVDPERIDFMGWLPATNNHLAIYNNVDIALDTFPYNGTTTTCEAMWMGVPVVTLAGDRHAGRVGVSLLTRVGLPELVANTLEDYIRISVELTRDLKRLESCRAGLRERMASSPLCDAPQFTRELETVYRDLWISWRDKH